MGSDASKSLDTYNKNVKEGASVAASYKYANENYDGTIEDWYRKQKEGEEKARGCFD